MQHTYILTASAACTHDDDTWHEQRSVRRAPRLTGVRAGGHGGICVCARCLSGEVLKGERDALFKLIQSLRREYEAVQSAKSNQDEEMRALKDRMMLGVRMRGRWREGGRRGRARRGACNVLTACTNYIMQSDQVGWGHERAHPHTLWRKHARNEEHGRPPCLPRTHPHPHTPGRGAQPHARQGRQQLQRAGAGHEAGPGGGRPGGRGGSA